MDLQRTASAAGIVACLLVLVVGFLPSVIVDAPGVGAYYAAGPTGLLGAGFLAIVGVIAFLSGRQGRTDPVTVAGFVVVLGLATAGLAALWAVSIDPTVLFSFPAEYAWLQWHRWAVPAVALGVPVSAAVYARATVAG
jgi:hypothetical protein